MKIEKIQRHTLKVLSMLLAVSLWFYILNSEPIEIEKKLPIEYILPQGMTMVSISEKEVTLKLKGSKAFISNIFSKREKFKIDLKPYYQTNGKNFRVKFYLNSIEVPFGVDVLDISPKETMVELDQKGMTTVPIKVQMIGELPKNRRLKEFHLSPDTVMLFGPIELLKRINKVDTIPLNMSLLTKDEGSFILQPTPIDPRINIDENQKLKFIYKTIKK